jgi:tetratricopeptide (TPR) repeat protein/4-amino-4-deoxy-L-arabinose transferase-like glycosyltransferase
MVPKPGKPWLTNGRSLAILGVFMTLIFVANALWLREDKSPPAWDTARYLVNSLDAFDLIREPSMAAFKDLYFVRNTIRPSIGMVLPTMPFYLLLGADEDTATLWTNTLFLAIIVFSIYGTGKQLFDIRVGLLAALLIGLNPEMIRLSRIYWPELGVAAVTSLAVYLLALSDFLRRRVFVLLAGLVLGWGLMERPVYPAVFLAGPAAFVFIGSFVAGQKTADDTLSRRFRSRFLPGVALFAVPVLLISAPFYLEYGRQMISTVSAFETAGTFAPVKDARSLQSFLWYATNLYASVSWPLHLLFAIGLIVYVSALVTRSIQPASAIVLAWVVVPYVTLSLTASKGFSYISALYPALTLLLAFAVIFLFRRSRAGQLAASTVVLALALLTYWQVSWAQPLPSSLANRLAMYAAPPSRELWPGDSIIRAIRRLAPVDQPVTIGVVSAAPNLAEPPLAYYARRQAPHMSVIRWSDPLPTLHTADFVVVKTGVVAADPPRTIEDKNATLVSKLLQQPTSIFYTTHQQVGQYALPDGSQAIIYQRRVPPSAEQMQTIVEELTAAAGAAEQSTAALVEVDRITLRSQVELGMQLFAEGRYEEALPVFQQVVDANPSIADAQQGLGRTMLALGNCDRAVEHQAVAAQLLSINGTHTVLGDMLLECGRVDEAIVAYMKGIELDPQEVRTHFVLAQAYMAKGRTADAIREFNRTIELDGNQTFVARAQRFLQQLSATGDTPTAVASDQAPTPTEQTQTDRAVLDGQVQLGKQLFAEGRYQEALPVFQQVVDANPNIADAQQGLARTMFALGNCAGAVEHQAVAVQLLSINGTYTVFGDILLECGRIDEAIEAYLRGIELEPLEVRTHFVLAEAYMAKGRTEDAIREFNRTIDLDTDKTFVERAQRFLQQLQSQ